MEAQVFKKKKLCRSLRKYATDSEKVLWEALRNRQLADTKFRRQYYISGYVLDFYCPKWKLAVEVDGNIHERDFVKEPDKARTSVLKEKGIKVIRFKNSDVLNHLEDVVDSIAGYIKKSEDELTSL